MNQPDPTPDNHEANPTVETNPKLNEYLPELISCWFYTLLLVIIFCSIFTVIIIGLDIILTPLPGGLINLVTQFPQTLPIIFISIGIPLMLFI
ncbi:MAG: hypothetical protein ACFFCO_09110 [Promethearchaeota archaeon]